MGKPESLAKDGGHHEYLAKSFDIEARQERQQHEIDRHNQWLLTESPYLRAKFMKELYDAADTKSLEKYENVRKKYREIFAKEVIGQLDDKLLPPNPRSRKTYEGDGW